jgi:hypothetical protein
MAKQKMTPERLKLHKTLFALLNTLYLLHLRQDLALQYSNGRTNHTSELKESEVTQLIHRLQTLQSENYNTDKKPNTLLQRTFFARCYELGWIIENGRLDYSHIESWLLKYSYEHKPFNDYTEEQLPKLITQLDILIKSKQKEVSDGK